MDAAFMNIILYNAAFGARKIFRWGGFGMTGKGRRALALCLIEQLDQLADSIVLAAARLTAD